MGCIGYSDSSPVLQIEVKIKWDVVLVCGEAMRPPAIDTILLPELLTVLLAVLYCRHADGGFMNQCVKGGTMSFPFGG